MSKRKKLLHEITAVVLIAVFVFSGVFTQPKFAEAATYTFTQTNWAGGATSTTATHPTNQTGRPD